MRDRRFEQAKSDRRLRTRREKEQHKQKLAIFIGVVVVLLVLAIPAYGYYASFIKPPRVLAGRVRDVKYTMGDLVKQIRTVQAAGRYTGNDVDLSSAPFQTLYTLVENEIVRQGAPGFGIIVTEDDVQQRLRENFYPEVPEGQETTAEQLDTEYQENYRTFLNTTGLSEKEYRDTVKISILRNKMRDELGKQVPTVEQSVEVYWMLIPFQGGGIDPRTLKEQLDKGEDFSSLAAQYGSQYSFADEKGYVGWVPKGAFPDLDKTLFSLELNKVADPVPTTEGTYVVKVVGGPELRDVTPNMRERLKDQAMQSWVSGQWAKGAEEKWLYVNFNSDVYAWVTKQIRQSRSPAQAANQQQQQR